jgi:hypothetical protein
MKNRWVLIVLLAGVAACGADTDQPAAEASEEAVLATRHACVSEELAREAEADLATLEDAFAALGGTAGSPTGAAGGAAVVFARAFQQHARLRAAAYAQSDSMLSHSPTPQDSARYAQAVERFEIRTPPPGSLEANVIRSYEQKIAAILADADHPCNWRHEVE